MPRHPSLSASAQAMPASVFEGLMRRAQAYPGRILPFQIGDTYLAPPEGCRLGELGFTSAADPNLYKYSPPKGEQQFVADLQAKLRERNAMDWVTEDSIQITMGATHALGSALRAVTNPGDSVLLLAPHWPLMRGISVSAGVRPVEVPFSSTLAKDPDANIVALLESYLTPTTTALYFSTPNNPDGFLFSKDVLAAIAQVARKHQLWILSDEVYEEFVFEGEHVSMASLPGMSERTLSVFSFSKSYAIPGLRVGYIVGPDDAMVAVRKMINHTVYNVPRAMQLAAHRALTSGGDWIDNARSIYRRHRDLAFDRIVAPCAKPAGSTYLFLDLGSYCERGQDNAIGVLERLVDAGMLLTPGGAFGHLFNKWARLCYAAVPEDQLVEGIDRLNEVLAPS